MQRDVEQKLKLYLYDSRDIPQIQAYLRNTEGSVPDHHIKEHHDKTSHNLFAARKSCFAFVKNTISMKHNKVKCN